MADNSYNIMVSNPVTPFTMARSFKACSNGKIFIGKPDTDPTVTENQIPVFVENEDGSTIQVAQPLVINSAGYPVYNGQAAKFVTNQNHSMAVYDSYMVQQFYWGDLSKVNPDALFSILSAFKGLIESPEGASNVGAKNGGVVEYYLFYVTPLSVGITEGDKSSSNYQLWQNLFAKGMPVVIPEGDWYCNGGAIEVNNMNISLRGCGRGISNIIFTTPGHGIRLITTTGTHQFDIHGLSILTSNTGSSNGKGSGFFYDSQKYLDTLTIKSNGYKYIGNRTLARGQISNVDFGGSDLTESAIGWGNCMQMLGCINYTANDIIARCPNNFTGDAFWIHGDGMIVDYRFTNIHVFWANNAFRINDYSEGFHLSQFELTNVQVGINCQGDSDTQVKSNLIYNSWYVDSGHIMAYSTAITVNWQVSGKYSNLEIFLDPTNSNSVYQGIVVTTADSVLVDNVAITLLDGPFNTAIGIQIGAGFGNKVRGVTLKGNSKWTNGFAFGSAASYTGGQLSDCAVVNSVNTVSLNWDNCSNNDIEPPNIIGSTDNGFPLAEQVIGKNNIKFRTNIINASYSYNGTSTQFTVDISKCGFQQVPLLASVTEPTTSYGGMVYSYRRDSSDAKKVVIQATSTTNTAVNAVNRPVFLQLVGV